jgi:hypothetical protein
MNKNWPELVSTALVTPPSAVFLYNLTPGGQPGGAGISDSRKNTIKIPSGSTATTPIKMDILRVGLYTIPRYMGSQMNPEGHTVYITVQADSASCQADDQGTPHSERSITLPQIVSEMARA